MQCVGQSSCSIKSSVGALANGDPCPNLPKTLSAGAICASGVDEKGGSLSMSCPSGQTIASISSAYFGTPGSSCFADVTNILAGQVRGLAVGMSQCSEWTI